MANACVHLKPRRTVQFSSEQFSSIQDDIIMCAGGKALCDPISSFQCRYVFFQLLRCKHTVELISTNLNQNEAQSSRAGSTHRRLVSARAESTHRRLVSARAESTHRRLVSSRAESTHRRLVSARKSSHKHNNRRCT